MRLNRLIDQDSLSEEQWEKLSPYIIMASPEEISRVMTIEALLGYGKGHPKDDKANLDVIDWKQVKRLLSWVVAIREYRNGEVEKLRATHIEDEYQIYILCTIMDDRMTEKEKNDIHWHLGGIIKRAKVWENISLDRVFLEWGKYEN